MADHVHATRVEFSTDHKLARVFADSVCVGLRSKQRAYVPVYTKPEIPVLLKIIKWLWGLAKLILFLYLCFIGFAVAFPFMLMYAILRIILGLG